MSSISVLICDDSAFMRNRLKKIIESDGELSVAAVARDGEDGVQKARELKPDVVTMDINMPKMDGITAMQHIVGEQIAPVIMLSSLTQEGAKTTFEALELGAFDFVGKPDGTVSLEIDKVADDIVSKIKAAARSGKRQLRRIARGRPVVARSTSTRAVDRIEQRRRARALQRESGGKAAQEGHPNKYKAVALGVSTGGPKNIMDVLPLLPVDLDAAIFVVQHMPENFTASYAERINDASELRCVEAKAGMVVEPGTIYLARGGSHLNLYKSNKDKVLIRTPKRPETQFVPSVDVMMASVLKVYGSRTVGVLMTGMGNDGAEGMSQIHHAGGGTLAESEESSVVHGMPRAAIELGVVDTVAPCWALAEEIVKAVSG